MIYAYMNDMQTMHDDLNVLSSAHASCNGCLNIEQKDSFATKLLINRLFDRMLC